MNYNNLRTTLTTYAVQLMTDHDECMHATKLFTAKEETTWFNIVAWDRLAETCSQYIHKGDQVYLEGRFVSRKYTDKDNIDRAAFEVVVTELELLQNKPKAEAATEGIEGNTGTFKGDAEFPF